MKLRIKGDSIRLRLLRSEVERFAADRVVTEEVRFGANALRYTLAVAPDATSICAEFSDGEIRVLIPVAEARRWTDGNDVGLEIEQSLGEHGSLTIIVEKDFVCLDRPDDPDRADAYPNPNLTC